MEKKNNKQKLKVLSLFSGIGAFEKALTKRNIDHEVVAYCEIDKYASTSYSAIHNIPEEKNLGDISKVDIKNIPDCDLVTYGFPCFFAGTLVLTSNGYKKIEDIKVGDRVLTHTNTFKDVLRIMDKDANEKYILETDVSEEIHVTGNHPFYVREKLNNLSNIENKDFTSPSWVEVKDLKANHFIGIAINKEEKEFDLNKYNIPNIYHNKLNKLLNSPAFWWIIGKWATHKVINEKSILINTNNDYVSPMLVEDKLKNISQITKIEFKQINTENFIITDAAITTLLDSFAKNEELFMNDIVNLPENLVRHYLLAYLLNDHYVSEEGETIIKLTNKEIAYSLGQGIAKAFKTTYRLIEISGVYYVSFFNEDTISNNTFYEDGYLWTRLLDKRRQDYNGVVFNMEVEEDNSYTVYNLIAHNCQDISNAGKKRGIIKGETRSGCLYYALDIIEEKKPKFAICENVKNLISKRFKKDFEDMLKILDEMGYNNYWKVINAKDQGIPQSRERVFVVSIRKDLEQEYTFPKDMLLECELEDLLEKEVDEKFYLSEKGVERIRRHNNKIMKSDTPKISGCIHAGYYKLGGRDQQYVKIKKTYEFPQDKELVLKLKDLLEKEVDDMYYVEKDRINVLLKEIKDKNCIAVREGTIKGYNEAYDGDSINIEYPNSIVRRGRVGKEVIQTLKTTTQICVVEKVEKPTNQTIVEKRLLEYAEENNDLPEFFNAYNRRTFDELAPTITTTIGGKTSINGLVKCEGIQREKSTNGIIKYDVPKTVRVRKYEVDTKKLKELLVKHKTEMGYSCREISRQSNVQQTLVEHWFRGDDSFAIPHPEVWDKLKKILNITTTEFDKAITEFEVKTGTYEKGNRIYDVEGNIPTLTTTCKEHTIVDLETFRIRSLTPLETWRLMGFEDQDYYKAKAALIEKHYKGKDRTNSQMYKQAGNSIVVDVLEGILEQLFK